MSQDEAQSSCGIAYHPSTQEKTNEIREDYVFQKKKEKAIQMLCHTFGGRVHKCKSKKNPSVLRNTSLIKHDVS